MTHFTNQEIEVIRSLVEASKNEYLNLIEVEKLKSKNDISSKEWQKSWLKVVDSLDFCLKKLKIAEKIGINLTKTEKSEIEYSLDIYKTALNNELPNNWETIYFWANISAEESDLIHKLDVVNSIYKKLKLKNLPNIYNLGTSLIDELRDCNECLMYGRDNNYYRIIFMLPNKKKAFCCELSKSSNILPLYGDRGNMVLNPIQLGKISPQFIQDELLTGQGVVSLVTTIQAKDLFLKYKEKRISHYNQGTIEGVYKILNKN